MISDHIENNIKQIKKERLYNITNLTDNILNYITDNNIIKGNILLSSHHILFLLYVLLIINVNRNYKLNVNGSKCKCTSNFVIFKELIKVENPLCTLFKGLT